MEEWAVRYDGPGDYDDAATAIAIDDSGNVYVTGSSWGSGTLPDYATVKYNPSGVEQWLVRYNGPGNNGDEATAIAVDDSGNVYVTGSSAHSLETLGDFVTVKYNASGVEQWTARYNGPGDWYDYASAIAVDDSGNVYVTGGGLGLGTGGDFATVKYDGSGAEQWVARYNGPANSSDGAYSIVLDASGNVYVTGYSQGIESGGDYATVKYDGSGVEQWVARYNGPGNGTDSPTAIAIDGAGNISVTGSSLGYDADYATVSYDGLGAERWVARYNPPDSTSERATAIAVDGSGNVYVTGYSQGFWSNQEYVTAKYNTFGAEQWVVRYSELGSQYDYPTGIAVDASGNVYVTGESGGAGTYPDYATMKYDDSGVEQWVARYDGPVNPDDEATGLAIDGSGNVYVTGSSVGSATSYDYATVKYDSSGVEQWIVRYAGPWASEDHARAIAIDPSGNVYVTGRSGAGSSFDYVTVKYDPAGVEQWAARYDGPGNSTDHPRAIALDGLGNVYVTGLSWDTVAAFDYATVSYSPSGVERWVARYDGLKNTDDAATALAIDDSGMIYVTGESSYDYATVKYDAAGVEQWVARYDGPDHLSDRAVSLAIDGSGNVYVTGSSIGSGVFADYATVKYSAAGVEQWVARYDGPGNGSDDPNAIAIDESGNVLVTGRSVGAGSSFDYATVKYNTAGVEQWVARYNGSGNSDDIASALAVDVSGTVYVTGYSWGSGNAMDFVTIKYTATGLEEWAVRYNGLENSEDVATALAIDGSGNIYVGGSTSYLDEPRYLTIRYYDGERFTYAYRSDWNLVSLPSIAQDPSPAAVFPSAVSALFEFTGGYGHSETLQAGRGYWIKFASDECVAIGGDTVMNDSIAVGAGWNLVGSITLPVSVDEVGSVPGGMVSSPFYGYDGGDSAYYPASVIEPGKAYWVKVDQPGFLVLSGAGGPLAATRLRILDTMGMPPPPPSDHVRPPVDHPTEQQEIPR